MVVERNKAADVSDEGKTGINSGFMATVVTTVVNHCPN
jgi:hypothetical protein